MKSGIIKLTVAAFFINILCPFVFAVDFAQGLISDDEINKLAVEIQKNYDSSLEREEYDTPSKEDYRPTVKQAKKVLSKAQNAIKRLDADKAAYYEEFFNKIKTVNGSPDINDVDTMKAYLAAYKLLKYDLNPPVISKYNRFNEDDSILGSTSIVFRQVLKKYQEDPAYLWLEEVLYTSDHFKMLPIENRQEVEKLADAFMNKRLKRRFGWNQQQIDAFLQDADTSFSSVTFCYDTNNEWNNWSVEVLLLTDGIYDEENKELFPKSLCALHELLHVQDIFPGQQDTNSTEDPLIELSTTFQDIVLSDIIYKQLKGIDLLEVVSYPQKSKKVDYGKLAVFLHKMIQKYGVHDITPLLLKPEVEQYIHDLYNANH